MDQLLTSRVGRELKILLEADGSQWTRNRIAQCLEDMYEQGLISARCDSHSLNRILDGTGSHASTIESVRQFFLHHTEVKVPLDMRDLQFDYKQFFDVPSARYSAAAKNLVGDF